MKLSMIAVSVTTVTFAFAALITPLADAAPPPGSSDKTIDGLKNLPCDGVIYPVMKSKNPYTEAAGDTVALVRGATQELSVSNSKETKNQVQISNTSTFTATVELSPKFSDIKNGKINFAYAHTYTNSYTDGTNVKFTQTNKIKLTAITDGLSATPVFQKLQAFGARYKCEVGHTEPVLVGPSEGLRLDIVTAQGWIIKRKDGTIATNADYTG